MPLFDRYVPPVMGAASSGAAGRKGLVPKPSAGDQAKMLTGAGTWVSLNGTFRGGVAGASVPATQTAAGDWYWITAAGTSQSKTWAVGDRAVYSGSSGNWVQIATQAPYAYNAPSAISAAGNTNLALGAGQSQRVEKVSVSAGSGAFTHTLTLQNTNAVAGCAIEGQVSVAASTNPRVELRNLTSGGTLLGAVTGDSVARVWNFTARFDGTSWFLTSLAKQRSASIDELNATVNSRQSAQGLVFDGTAGATVSGIPAFGTGDFTVVARVRFAALNNGSDQIIFSGASNAFGLIQRNTTSRISASKPGVGYTASTNYTDFVVGKTYLIAYVRSGGALGTYYVNGVADGTTVDSYNYTVANTSLGANNFGGRCDIVAVENRALTAAEVLALYETGAPAAGDYKDSTQTLGTPVNSVAADQNFSSDTGYWTKTNATISGGACNLTGAANANIAKAAILKTGKRYRITLNVTTGDANMYISDASVAVLAAVTTTGVQSFDVTGGAAGGFQLVSPAGTAVIDDLTITPIGLLIAPEAAAPGNGYQWQDMSGNKADITLPATGVAWALPDRRPNSVRGTITYSAAHDARVIGPGSIPANAVVTLATVKATAGSTGSGVAIKDANAVQQFAAHQAFTTAKKVLTLANNGVPADSTANSTYLMLDPDTLSYTGTIEVEVHYTLSGGNP
jgi:hypothetical protein